VLTRTEPKALHGWLLALFFVCLLAYLFKYAWLAEDAFINFRVIRNALAGHGLTWNPGERVQVFTSPLWLLMTLGVSFLTDEQVFSTLLLSVVLMMAVCVVLYRTCNARLEVYLPLVVLFVLSPSVRDYATSGLETPLLMLALAVFYQYSLRPATVRGLRRVALLGGLCALVRHDSILMTLPFLLGHAWQLWQSGQANTKDLLRTLLVGVLPLGLWSLFALFYFGSPVPNTAAAKMVQGFDHFGQMVHYVGFNVVFDPLAWLLMSAALVSCWGRGSLFRSALFALASFFAYLTWIGGDYMAGRFLLGPIVLSISLLAQAAVQAAGAETGGLPKLGMKFIPLAVMGGVAVGLPNVSLFMAPSPPIVHGIADERHHYFGATDLVTLMANGVQHRYRESAQLLDAVGSASVVVSCNIGILGYYVQRPVRIIDPLALADRFLAGLPLRPGPVRVGHFERIVPQQYLLSRVSGQNVFVAPELRKRFEDLDLVANGALWAPGRLGAIWRTFGGTALVGMASLSPNRGGVAAHVRPEDQAAGEGRYKCLGSGGGVLVPEVINDKLVLRKL
jgi:arabinofuranosyltransferase